MTLYKGITEVIDLARELNLLAREPEEQIRMVQAHANAIKAVSDKRLMAKYIGNVFMAIIVLGELYNLNILDCLHVALNARLQALK